jgi:phage tail sheath protein FI
MNALVVPGIKNTSVHQKMVATCETRGDSIAIVDIQGDYDSAFESTAPESSRKPDVQEAADYVKSTLSLNSSYGCAFFPWVMITDPNSGNKIWVPPSVPAIGTFGSTKRFSEVWFAPAGFTRGGLSSNNAGGLPVVQVSRKLTSKERDILYTANINPIASFPSEGIVVFGQKTLQSTPSALDRINVRRLMNYVKKEISRIASTILFDPNVQATWNVFLGEVRPFLQDVQARLGITEFKVVLDETTTTPELIDRNILYAKIFIKPARAIEFIALDFVITNTGASFND